FAGGKGRLLLFGRRCRLGGCRPRPCCQEERGDQSRYFRGDAHGVLHEALDGQTFAAKAGLIVETSCPPRDHFGGTKTSMAVAKNGRGGISGPTKSPRSGAVLCAALFHCAMLSTTLLVEPIAMWLNCK